MLPAPAVPPFHHSWRPSASSKTEEVSILTVRHMIDCLCAMQVGAALSMVYVSGAPIMFVGCGQTYVDLKRLNVKSVVRSLLK